MFQSMNGLDTHLLCLINKLVSKYFSLTAQVPVNGSAWNYDAA